LIEKNSDRLPEILSTEIVAKTSRLKVERVHLRFSNAEERFYERTLADEGSVLVLPVLDQDTILLIREYAVGLERYCLGFPKGAVDSGELPDEAANRELKEEVGYGANTLQRLATLASSPAYSNHEIHAYVASDLYLEQLVGDEPEPLVVVPWKISEIDSLLAHPDFVEARSLALLLLWLKERSIDA
jgi:ADP-ribose diphosphatase